MNLQEHQNLQLEIPEYVTSRLDEEAVRRVEAHVAACEDCADLVETGRTLVAAAGATESLLEAHPESGRLMSYAIGEIDDADGALERHVASCVSCKLELEVWRRQGEAPGFGLQAPARRPSWFVRNGFAAASLAAGLILGAAVTVLVRSPGGDWSGAVPLVVIEAPLRGDATPVEVRVAPAQPYVPLAVAPVLPSEIDDSTRFRFDIVDDAGASVWSIDMTAGAIRGPLDTAGVVSFLVPSSKLDAGHYTLLFGPAGPGEEPLLESTFVIVTPAD